MSKVLVVSPTSVFPPLGGNRARILALALAIRELGHELHFALISHDRSPKNWHLHVKQFGESKTHILPVSRFAHLELRLKQTAATLARRFFAAIGSERRHQLLLDEWLPAGLKAPVRALHKKHGFDAVAVEFVWNSKLLDYFPADVRKLIDTHDVYENRHKRMTLPGRPYRAFTTSRAAETRGLRRADALLAIEDKEANHFRTLLGGTAKVFSVSHFIPTARPVSPSTAEAAVYFGAMTRGNIDTFEHLIRDIMPLIWAVRPSFRLYAGGNIAKHDLAKSAPGIVPVGPVDDMADLFSRGPLLLNPTRIGTGIAIKVLETLGHGVPVISSVHGARGHARHGSGIVIPTDDSPLSFAKETLGLVDDIQRRTALHEEGIAFAKAWNEAQRSSLRSALA